MSGFLLTVRLHLAESESYRISGWRGVCSFDGVVAPDGASLFGCELTLESADRLAVGQEVAASLRFWISRAYVPGLTPGLRLHLFEGDNEIASGTVVAVRDENT
jgi:hypothetical protein